MSLPGILRGGNGRFIGGVHAESITIYKDKVFTIGDRRYQVIRLKPNTSLGLMPGTRNGYIVIGQLP